MELRLDACDATRPADRVGRDRFARGCCDVADSTEWEAAMGRRFGDPIVGVAKRCHLPPPGPSGYATTCATEGSTCGFSGMRTVAFGARGPVHLQVVYWRNCLYQRRFRHRSPAGCSEVVLVWCLANNVAHW